MIFLTDSKYFNGLEYTLRKHLRECIYIHDNNILTESIIC